MLEAVQGKVPDHTVVVLGNRKEETYPLPAYYSYFLNLKEQFLKAQTAFQSDWNMMPDLALCLDYGVWSTFAKEQLEKSDSLALVANIRKSQIKKLLETDINTLSELATTHQTTIKGISSDTFDKLKAQAAIQLASRSQEKPLFTVLNQNDGKGLSGLPPKSKLDFVFDINRLNVAISRAQALAIIVANEGLEQCKANSLAQMAKVGFIVRLNLIDNNIGNRSSNEGI